MEKEKSTKEMRLLDIPEDDDTPQEVKDWEQKYAQEVKNDEQKDLKEMKNEEDICFKNTFDEKGLITTTGNVSKESKESKEFKTNTLILNFYWIHLVSKISFCFFIIVYEILGSIIVKFLIDLIGGTFDNTLDLISFCYNFGIKWLFLTSVSQHLALGFFCLTNFSTILKETKNTSNFLIRLLIKSILFYFFSILIMKVIVEDYIFKELTKKVNKAKISSEDKEITLEVINLVKKKVIKRVGNLLGNFNNYLDKLLMGTLYITLFSSPKFIKEKYMLYFRLLSILPIIFIILSLILRGLNDLEKITLNLYISPIFVGPKFTIFGFFICVLLYN